MIEAEHAEEEGEIAHEERRARVRSLRAGEAQAIRRMSELLADIVEIYRTDYVVSLRELDSLAHPAEARLVPAAHRQSWRGECVPLVNPAFGDLENALSRLLAVMCDPGGAGYRETKNPEAARSDYGRVLPSLTPDLRSTLRSPVLSVLAASRSRPGRAAR